MNGNVPICTFCAGAVKPNVVFFGEDLPEKYFQHAEDFPKADLLMIMGTSLKVGLLLLLLMYKPFLCVGDRYSKMNQLPKCYFKMY